MGGGDLTDRVARHQVRHHAPVLQQPVQGHLEREQRGLRVLRPVQQVPTVRRRGGVPHHLPQRAVRLDVQMAHDLVQGGGEHRVPVVEFPPHAGPLAALAGEQERGAPLDGLPGDQGGVLRAGRQGGEAAQCLLPAVRQQHGPVLQRGPADGQGVGHIAQLVLCGRLPVASGEAGAQLPGLGAQRRPAPGRHDQRHRCRQGCAVGAGRVLGPLPRCRAGLLPRCLLQDDVRVGAADAERRHPGAARASVRRPREGLGQQLHGTRRPVDVRGGPVDVERSRQHAVPHRHDHLDHPRDAGRRLGVPDVGLERAEPQRTVLRPPLAVGGEQRLGLDRVTQRRTGTVRLHRVHVGGVQARRRQRLLDDALLGGAVGRGQAVGGTVLVHGGAADHRQDAPALAPGVRQPHQDQHTGPLAPAGTVGRRRERLADAVRGQTPLPAEGGEDTRAADDGHTTGEGERALTLPQRLAGEVQRHQGARAGRVHGEGGALQAERVGGAAGDDTGRDTGEQVSVQAVGCLVQTEPVLLRLRADEGPRAAAAQGVRIDARVLQGLPAQLQDQPLLRVHGGGLAGPDAEELGVETARVLQEGGVAHIALAGLGGVGVVEVVHVPAAVGGQGGEGVTLLGHQTPQGVR
ncbi:hypothetical protein GCM10010280_11050 [Streptomyces pilosus]|uniref:Uncharacterized protein n=1 Tax=Streptomyces pilosus TaxID=28893 RepID=A0A918BGI8_9ACTN|nr:hypothetical protein GCM10010280_11050 [Streptomyces pilosus]